MTGDIPGSQLHLQLHHHLHLHWVVLVPHPQDHQARSSSILLISLCSLSRQPSFPNVQNCRNTSGWVELGELNPNISFRQQTQSWCILSYIYLSLLSCLKNVKYTYTLYSIVLCDFHFNSFLILTQFFTFLGRPLLAGGFGSGLGEGIPSSRRRSGGANSS